MGETEEVSGDGEDGETMTEWPVVLLKLFAGGGAGILAFVGVSEFLGGKRKSNLRALIVALACFIVAGAVAMVRIGKPAGAMAVARNISSGSPTSLEFLAFALCVAAIIVYLIIYLRESNGTKVMGVAGAILGALMCFISGYSHYMIAISGIPEWNSPALPVSFTTSGLALGGFAWLAIYGFKQAKEAPGLQKVSTIILAVFCTLTLVASAAYGLSVKPGSLTVAYWLLVPVVAGVVGLVVAVLLLLKPNAAWVWLGVVAMLVGGLLLRTSVWLVIEGIAKLSRG
jgi:DMSO reductase anchor subunit